MLITFLKAFLELLSKRNMMDSEKKVKGRENITKYHIDDLNTIHNRGEFLHPQVSLLCRQYMLYI